MKTAGRFGGRLHPDALRFSSSLSVDSRLFREDVAGSIAHAEMLGARKIIPRAEASRIVKALRGIGRDLESGRIDLSPRDADGRWAAEDVHMAIEAVLARRIGRSGLRLHTARSRNDQVALDMRLYLRGAIQRAVTGIRLLQRSLLGVARKHRTVLMPGYTHLQRAQPILLAHHLMAHLEMLERDRERLLDCLKRVNRSPLGAAALAGTSFPIDRRATARSLGMSGLVENSIDAVSDRDVHLEFLAACAITMMHLSRQAEEVVLWHSEEWNFAQCDEEFTTGSSIMPQKRNPDMAELVRGKSGRVYGALVSLLVVMKGLPLAYNRDLQEDKEPVFDASDTLESCLRMMAALFRTMAFNKNRFEQEHGADFLMATELADYLVRKGLPFRKAHAAVGGLVRQCVDKRVRLRDLPLTEYRKRSTLFERDVFALLDPRRSLRMKRSEGSTSPQQVDKAIRKWERTLAARPRKPRTGA